MERIYGAQHLPQRPSPVRPGDMSSIANGNSAALPQNQHSGKDCPDAALPKPQTSNGDLTQLPPALEHLRDQKVWLCWCWFWNGKKWTKPPRRVDDPSRNAATNDPATWGTYEQAVAQVLAGKADGIGIALKDRDLGANDLDHCRDPVTGRIEPWADDYVRRFPGAYVEITVSGKGLRVLGRSQLKNFSRKHKLQNAGNGAAIELFSNSNHYVTLSCNTVGSCSTLPPIDNTLLAVAAELGVPRAKLDATLDFDAPPRASDAPPIAPADDAGAQEPPAASERAPAWSFAKDMRLRSAIAAIPTDEKVLAEKLGHSHDIFVDIGRAIAWLGWGERGYAIWRDWCAQNPAKFDEKGLRTQWASLCRSRNKRERPITIATVYHYAIKCGWRGDLLEVGERGKPDDDLVTTMVADLEMCGLDWLWPGRFARGKFGLIAGMPDMGKGQIAAFITAAITNAVALPCDEGVTPQGNVIWFNAEDGASDTIKPRLIAAGADVTRVHVVDSARVDGKARTFNLVTDLQLLRKAIERISNVVAIIIDPVSAYIGVGKVDGRQATDVRGILTPVKNMAE